jgi:hypothetical protein
MWKRKLMMGALAAASIAWMPLPASAQVYVEVAPPAPRHEMMPRHREGYVWSPGYWDLRNGRHVWVRGHWVRERPGMYWHPNRWVERDGRWYFERGRWDRERYAYRDRDRDGVPNRYDRDRDNDGVPNRFDDRPNNPYRQ